MLGNLADTQKKKLNRKGSRVWAYEIETGVIFAFAQSNMLGDLDAMQANLDEETKPKKAQKTDGDDDKAKT
jgi:hypothetical protein